MSAWSPGDVVVFRHLCGERCWFGVPVYVVRDGPELVAVYLPGGAPFRYVPGPWPTENGHHPWHPAESWSGHGVLMLQRPGDPYGVWVFWRGDEREHVAWYLNIHEWSRTADGFAIRDLELDVVARADGSVVVKDEELVDVRVDEGRMSAADAAHARAVAGELIAMLDRGECWWDDAWAEWAPPPEWTAPPPIPATWTP